MTHIPYEAYSRRTKEVLAESLNYEDFLCLLSEKPEFPEGMTKDTKDTHIQELLRREGILIRQKIVECAVCLEPMNGRDPHWGTCCSSQCARDFYD